MCILGGGEKIFIMHSDNSAASFNLPVLDFAADDCEEEKEGVAWSWYSPDQFAQNLIDQKTCIMFISKEFLMATSLSESMLHDLSSH